jgi:hypothetical protein
MNGLNLIPLSFHEKLPTNLSWLIARAVMWGGTTPRSWNLICLWALCILGASGWFLHWSCLVFLARFWVCLLPLWIGLTYPCSRTEIQVSCRLFVTTIWTAYVSIYVTRVTSNLNTRALVSCMLLGQPHLISLWVNFPLQGVSGPRLLHLIVRSSSPHQKSGDLKPALSPLYIS